MATKKSKSSNKSTKTVSTKSKSAAKTAKKAYAENISLKDACVSLGFLTAERFDEVFHPEKMI